MSRQKPEKHGFYRANDPEKSIYAIYAQDITVNDALGKCCHDQLDPTAVIFNETFRFQKKQATLANQVICRKYRNACCMCQSGHVANHSMS
jgi:hypothetical protein